ncbi:glycosyltransferase [bacterium]|nr:MAG: glycosyltransferase [bacterium]
MGILSANDTRGPGGEEMFVRTLRDALITRGVSVRVIDRSQAANTASASRWDSISRPVARFARFEEIWQSYAVGREASQTRSSGELMVVNSHAGWWVPDLPGLTVYHGTRSGFGSAVQPRLSLSYAKSRYGIGPFEARSAGRRLVVAVSHSAADELLSLYGLVADAVLLNAVDIDQYHPRDRATVRRHLGLESSGFLALFTGRPGRHKGTDLLTEISRGLPADITIVAAVPRRYDAHPRTRQLVGLDHDRIAELYAACDAFVFPSRWEACSYSLVEALASGLPPVASRVGHMPEVCASDESLDAIAPANLEPAAFIRSLISLRDRPDLRNSASRAARRFAESNHDAMRWAHAYISLLERAESANRN